MAGCSPGVPLISGRFSINLFIVSLHVVYLALIGRRCGEGGDRLTACLRTHHGGLAPGVG